NKLTKMNEDKDASKFVKENAREFKEFVMRRFNEDVQMLAYFDNKLNDVVDDWYRRANTEGDLKYKALLKKPSQKSEGDVDWTEKQYKRRKDTDKFNQIKSTL